jgi:hypothetical protein
MEIKCWDLGDLEAKLKSEEAKYDENNHLKVEDNYYTQNNNYCAFNAVSSLLACSTDYSEKKQNVIDSIDVLKDKLRNDYEISFISSLEQRINHITFQNSNTR